ncbi:hypothetical protein L1987_22665 [Smallanthus sonchifolius]|uniref:Uncharacterized protein n=1 Tax=Smallanthus sonchifolius TaxID=185202 RepID=A0ACB9IG33_9ASTR|nr:hypothetical protein L1987_22665 [Smallanthus sonchifolius]
MVGYMKNEGCECNFTKLNHAGGLFLPWRKISKSQNPKIIKNPQISIHHHQSLAIGIFEEVPIPSILSKQIKFKIKIRIS